MNKNPLNAAFKSLTQSKKIEKARRFISLHEDKIKNTVKFSSAALSDANSILNANKKPGILGYATLIAKVKTHYDQHLRSGSWHRFAKEWETLCSHAMANILVDALLAFGNEDSLVTLQNSRVFVHDEFIVAWNSTSEGRPHTPLYVNKGAKEVASKWFEQLVWQYFGSIVFVEEKRNQISFLSQGEGDIFHSDVAEKYSAQIAKFLAKGRGRSFLFYGPPGTGKSNILKNIARNLNAKCLRFKYSSLNGAMSLTDIEDILTILQPDAVIVEDIDHDEGGGSNVLYVTETLAKRGKLVLMTANTIGKLSDASMRCGRFSKVVEIDKIDDDVIHKLTNNDVEIYEIVKDWPVSAIMEVMERVNVLGKEEALDDLDDIKKRVETAKKNYKENKNATIEKAKPVETISLNKYVPHPDEIMSS